MRQLILIAAIGIMMCGCGKKDDAAKADKAKAAPGGSAAASKPVDPAAKPGESPRVSAEVARAGAAAVEKGRQAANLKKAAMNSVAEVEAEKTAAGKKPTTPREVLAADKARTKADSRRIKSPKTPVSVNIERVKAGPIPSKPSIPNSTLAIEAPYKGPQHAKVTIIEISDFQCPFCGRVIPTMKTIRDTWPNDVNITFKHNPLTFHKRAMPAAIATLAAHRQGYFWPMHDALFLNQKRLEDADLLKYASQLGMNEAQFKKDIADPALRLQVENDQKAVVSLGQGGTPAFFINGKKLSGAQAFPKFKEIIEAEIKAADELLAKGTPIKDIHQARSKANLANKGTQYWKTLILGLKAPRQTRPVDPTVWKVSVTGKEPIKGKTDALVTIVEFSDFECPFCTKANPTLTKVMEKFPNDVRIVWKNNALPFHKRALPAARAALAAHQQGKFWEYHDKLFANQKSLKDTDLQKYAEELGLDLTQWKDSLKSEAHKLTVAADMDLAQKINARGTPNFFVNGRNLRGAVAEGQFSALIEEELEKAKKLVATGTPAAEVYAKTIEKGKLYEPLDSKVNDFDFLGRPYMGAKDGDIVIVEYSDFQCPYCKRISNPIKALLADPELKGRVKVVWKNFPLAFHKRAKPAAIAASAANRQGKFWEFHDKAFANMKTLTDDNFVIWAKELGMDAAKFEADIKNPAVTKLVADDMAEARKAGLTGTPTIYINGRKFQSVTGYTPAAFKSVINQYFPKK
jgi:protein-disulfide isomerase